jgi:hypothetical protein
MENNKGFDYKEEKREYTLDRVGRSHSPALLFENLIWLTTEEAALFLRKSCHALRQMVYKGKVSARKFNRRLYFKKSELHQLIDISSY